MPSQEINLTSVGTPHQLNGQARCVSVWPLYSFTRNFKSSIQIGSVQHTNSSLLCVNGSALKAVFLSVRKICPKALYNYLGDKPLSLVQLLRNKQAFS